ncbi:MAG: O-antigen polymerase [Novosphingobium sp.]
MYFAALGLGVLISLGVLLVFSKSPAFSLFHPLAIYSAFHVLIFVIRPIFAYLLDYSALYVGYSFTPSPEDKLTVILAANLGFVVFAFFSLRAGNIAVQFKADAAAIEERARLARAFAWTAAICAPLAIYSLARNYSTENSLYAGMVTDYRTGISINTKGNGYISDAQLMLVSLTAYWAWLGRFRLVALAPFAAYVVLRAGTGGRGPFVAALIIAGLLYLYDRRQRFPGFKIVLAIVAAATFFVSVGADRGQSLRVLIGLQDASRTIEYGGQDEKFMESMDFANLEFFEYVVWVVPRQSGTYDYFLNNLQLFTEPIPRVLWPGKPVGAPIQPVKLWDYGQPIGMTMSLPGQGWFSAGWLGVVIWCGLWGHALGWVYRRYWQSDQSALKTATYMTFMATLVVAFRDGNLVTVAKQAGPYLLPVLVWHIVARFQGVPRLGQLRARLREWQGHREWQGQAGAAIRAVPTPTPIPTTEYLPPAVRRRRALLEAARQG